MQSHPKHLERLFDPLAINRKLKPKRAPGHPLLDEPDNRTALGPAEASVCRSCVGVLSCMSSDYVECQYTTRGLSQTMSAPTTQSMMCLRHLAQNLPGCADHALVLRYEAHQGLLHYNPCVYTLEIFSDSDWAKHRQSRKSVSGYLFLFGCLLYATSRSQRALALSSEETEICHIGHQQCSISFPLHSACCWRRYRSASALCYAQCCWTFALPPQWSWEGQAH